MYILNKKILCQDKVIKLISFIFTIIKKNENIIKFLFINGKVRKSAAIKYKILGKPLDKELISFYYRFLRKHSVI